MTTCSSYSTDKDIARMVSELVSEGWIFARGRKHGKLTAPNGSKIIVSVSPSCYRSAKNFKAEIKRMKETE